MLHDSAREAEAYVAGRHVSIKAFTEGQPSPTAYNSVLETTFVIWPEW